MVAKTGQQANKIGPTGHPFQLDLTQEEDWRSLIVKKPRGGRGGYFKETGENLGAC
jgi:hypothetical protein